MIRKKLVILSTTLLLGFSSFGLPSVFAENNQEKYNQIKEQRSEIQSEIESAAQELVKIQEELDQINKQIERVNQAIKDNQKVIEDTKIEIDATQVEIDQLEKEMAVLQESIEQRFEILKKRAVTLQQSGGSVSYLEVLAGSSSFSDFVDRVFAVMTIAQSDADLIEQQQLDQQKLEGKQETVEKKLEELTNLKTEHEGMLAQILEQKKQTDILKEELKQREQANLTLKAELQSKDRNLAAKATELQQRIMAETVVNNTQNTNTSSNQQTNVEQVNSTKKTNETTKPSAPASTNVSGSLSDAIKASYRYIGNSVYVFGGGRNAYDIANGRFDCSGFVSYVFSQAGIRVGASTDSLKYAGRQVPASEMRYGDLVFFNTYKTDGHVGIYIGGGKFIGSQNSTGVAIADMTSGYWKQKFNGRVVRVQ